MGRFLAFVLASWGIWAASAHADEDWAPISRTELASTTARIEPGADAEVLFWDVHVEDKVSYLSINTEFWQYVRIKIFTERGRELHGKVALSYGPSTTLDDVEGRTIRPDGSITALKPEDVFESTLLRARRSRWRAKTFAMPGVEAGAVIEYRWHEIRHQHVSAADRLEFQREIPVRDVIYHLWPLSVEGESLPLRTYFFNAPSQTPRADPDGFLCLSMKDVPAFREEPHMPPESRVKPWVLVDYPFHHTFSTEEFWRAQAQAMADRDAKRLKPTHELANTAWRIVNGASDGLDSLARLYTFCQREIRNIYEDDSTLSSSERAALIKERTPSAVLADRVGTPVQINLAFAGLAKAAKFDVRWAWAGDRSDVFDAEIPVSSLMTESLVAVRQRGEWKLLDPGSPQLPFGRLRWQVEGTRALLADPEKALMLEIPPSPAESSVVERTARLVLGTDGALEGEGRIRYAGHWAVREREQMSGETDAHQQQRVRDLVTARFGVATVTNIRVVKGSDFATLPGYSFHVRAPGFAQRIGSRMVVHPFVFQHRAASEFGASERRHPIWFEFAWSEVDSVEIELPPGFVAEGAAETIASHVGDSSEYSRLVALSADGRYVRCSRSFVLSDRETSAAKYAALKSDFDRVLEADSRTLVLREGADARK